MPRVTIPIQTVLSHQQGIPSTDGVVFTAADAVNDHQVIPKSNKLVLLAVNTDGSTKDFDILVPANSATYQNAITRTITIAATLGLQHIPLDSTALKQSDGFIHIDITDATGVSFAVVEAVPTPS